MTRTRNIRAVAADGWLKLPEIGVVRATGNAVAAFLSRQLSCDIAALVPGRPMLGAWLTSKGRVITLLHLVALEDGTVLLLLPAELADEVLARLRLFVLREDVRLAADADLQVLGLAGRAARAAATVLPPGGELPALVPLGNTGDAALLLGPAAAVHGTVDRLGVAELAAEHWRAALIEAGLPQVGAATRESFIPQMLNLDRLGAVSFTKGCYPGQEIVARTQNLGRIKRRMYIARAAAGAEPAQPGDPIAVDGAMDAAGRVVLAAHDGAQQVLLAVLPLDAVAAGAAFRLGGAHGPLLAISEPPYALDGAVN